jgi:hypothetical protein
MTAPPVHTKVKTSNLTSCCANNKMALKDFSTVFTIRDTRLIIADAWEEVSNKCI